MSFMLSTTVYDLWNNFLKFERSLHDLDSKKLISIKALILSFFLQEIDVQGKKAIMIFVPVPQLRAYQKIQTRLVRELEKKFSGKHVVFIAQVGCGVFFLFVFFAFTYI